MSCRGRLRCVPRVALGLRDDFDELVDLVDLKEQKKKEKEKRQEKRQEKSKPSSTSHPQLRAQRLTPLVLHLPLHLYLLQNSMA